MSAAERLRKLLAHRVVTRFVLGPLRPVVRSLPQQVLRRIPIVGKIMVAVPGTSSQIELYSDGGDAIANFVFWNGVEGWEPETARALCLVAPQCSTFLDIGANVGYHALLVAAASPATTVHAFEPVSTIFERLTTNVELNALDNIVLHQRGLSNVAGRATIYIPRQIGVLPLQASLLAYPDHEGIEQHDVDVTTVDDFVQEHRILRVDLMKIDVEGAEHLVLAGAESTLKRDLPVVVCEVLPHQPGVGQVDETLRRHGYEFFSITSSGLHPMPGLEPHPDGKVANYLCAHPHRLQQDFPKAAKTVAARRR